MSGYSFGAASIRNRDTCDPRLIALADAAIAVSYYDWSLIEGHRNLKRQQKLFDDGFSLIDGVTEKGKHNYTPSRAWDFQPWPTKIDGVSCWSKEGAWRFHVINGIILAQAAILDIRIRSGQDWDGDGSAVDQELHDLGHIELIGD